jgi:hypothetical protein
MSKANFCEGYINRHFSADKYLAVKQSRTQLSHSSLSPIHEAKQSEPMSNDLFTLMRNQ